MPESSVSLGPERSRKLVELFMPDSSVSKQSKYKAPKFMMECKGDEVMHFSIRAIVGSAVVVCENDDDY